MKNILKCFVFICVSLVFILNSCSVTDEDNSFINSKPVTLELVSGEGQSNGAGKTLSNSIVVLVKDRFGNVLSDTAVNFSVTEGSVSPEIATTGSDGKATVTWSLGATLGVQTLLIASSEADSILVNATAVQYSVGDFHEGGIIFYVDTTGEHGLVCAITDQSTSAIWCGASTAITAAQGTGRGTGNSNTLAIVSECTTGDPADNAGHICANLSLNSYTDWFLPSKDELDLMYQSKAVIDIAAVANGGTAFANSYWSSSEYNDGHAWRQNFGGGNQFYYIKTTFAGPVRAVRVF